MRSPVSRGSTSGGPNDGGRGGEPLRARERRRVEDRDRRRGGGARDPRLGPRPRRRGDGRRGSHLLLPCGEEEARLHRDAAEAEQAAQARAQDLRGLRLLQDPGPGRGRAGQAPVAGRPLRAPQRRLRRARRHREDAPRAGLRARVLHAGAQDLLHQGDRAQGQVPEGRPAGKHLAGRLLARQAVVPHRGRGGEMRLRQAVHRPVLRCRRQALREGGAERDGPHE